VAPRERSFNPVKFGVGVVNIARGGLSIIRSVEKPEDPADLSPLKRTFQFARGFGNFRRGLRQTNEALDDPNGPSPGNLLGLLPFGQLFDDPLEPTPQEFGAQRLRMLRRDFPGTVKRLIREFFVFDEAPEPSP
jgi:hypothetical protein